MTNLYKVLSECEELTALLAHGKQSIYKDQAPNSTPLPLVVFVRTGSSGLLHGDNTPLERVNAYSVYYISADGDDYNAETIIYETLTKANLIYKRTARTMDYTEHILGMDFVEYNFKGDKKWL